MRLLLLLGALMGSLIGSFSVFANGAVQALPNADLDRIYRRTAPATTVTQATPVPPATRAPSSPPKSPKTCGLFQDRVGASEYWIIYRTPTHTLGQWRTNGDHPAQGRYNINSHIRDSKYRVEILYQGPKNWVWTQNGQSYPIGEIKNYWIVDNNNIWQRQEQVLIENHRGEYLLFYIDLSRTMGRVQPLQLEVTDPCELGVNEFGGITTVK